MPNTYDPIATQTLVSTAATVTFSSIPATYTDLVLIVNAKDSSFTNRDIIVRFNSDTGSNYSITYIYGNGSTAASGRYSNNTYCNLGYFTTRGTTDGYVGIANIMNYSNTTTNKTMLTRSNAVSSDTSLPGTEAIANLWRSTAAINSVALTSPTSTFAIGSTFTLYGIKAA